MRSGGARWGSLPEPAAVRGILVARLFAHNEWHEQLADAMSLEVQFDHHARVRAAVEWLNGGRGRSRRARRLSATIG